jgi:hypothetical protein
LHRHHERFGNGGASIGSRYSGCWAGTCRNVNGPNVRRPVLDSYYGHPLEAIRSIEIAPNNQSLLSGKEDEVFPLLAAAGRLAIEQDGAEVLLLGSTTMHQAHAYLQEHLPVPVINPGPLSYKIAETALALKLSHSRVGYPKPMYPKLEMVQAMLQAAADWRS